MYQPGNIADLTVDSLDLLFGKSGSAAVAGNGTVPKRRIDKQARPHTHVGITLADTETDLTRLAVGGFFCGFRSRSQKNRNFHIRKFLGGLMMFVNSGCKCIGHQTVRIKRTTQFRSLTASICTYRLVGEQKLVRIRSEQTLSYRKRNEKKSATTLRSDPCRHRGHRLCNIGQQSEQLPTDVPVHP